MLLKVSAPPYLLLLDLFAEVDSAATAAAVSEQSLTFTLQKVQQLAEERLQPCHRLISAARWTNTTSTTASAVIGGIASFAFLNDAYS